MGHRQGHRQPHRGDLPTTTDAQLGGSQVGGAEHPAVLTDGQDGDNADTRVETDHLAERGGLLDDDLAVGELLQTYPPHEVRRFVLAGGAGDNGDLERAFSLTDLLQAPPPFLGA